ncbi:hypothetical protein, partial [Streptomyces sp. SBT349]|uniref:hypothetical protein n=1 Tax=Streptomyces sp. SBT349 TaxID=1580539 RepID=UPI00066D7AA8
RNAGPVLLVWAVSLVVLFYERDLGTSLIFFGVFVVADATGASGRRPSGAGSRTAATPNWR